MVILNGLEPSIEAWRRIFIYIYIYYIYIYIYIYQCVCVRHVYVRKVDWDHHHSSSHIIPRSGINILYTHIFIVKKKKTKSPTGDSLPEHCSSTPVSLGTPSPTSGTAQLPQWQWSKSPHWRAGWAWQHFSEPLWRCTTSTVDLGRRCIFSNFAGCDKPLTSGNAIRTYPSPKNLVFAQVHQVTDHFPLPALAFSPQRSSPRCRSAAPCPPAAPWSPCRPAAPARRATMLRPQRCSAPRGPGRRRRRGARRVASWTWAPAGPHGELGKSGNWWV